MEGEAHQRGHCPRQVDAMVIGGGHAGIEATWALARLGHSVAMVTFDANGLGRMSCNPSVGGLAKGQLVREIDALGGLMGRLIDRSGIHFRILNRGKGPAVQAPRAQADGRAYSRAALSALSAVGGVTLIEAEVTAIEAETAQSSGKKRVCGVRLGPVPWRGIRPGGAHAAGARYPEACDPSLEERIARIDAHQEIAARAIIIATGTFLRGMLFTGMDPRPGGRRGEPPADALTGSLENLGLRFGRLKTGTPPRLRRASLDLSILAAQTGDEPPPRFSFFEGCPTRNRVICHLTHTVPDTHRIIAGAMDRSPLYGGLIDGIGPRYCPSIEDKVMRFPERESHQVFLEPEGLDEETVYPSGLSTSLPRDVQEGYLRTIPGLREAEIVHPGYAVEYDFLLTSQIEQTLEVAGIRGLFSAGQINGTSGYEEAAAQGIMAGINAHAHLAGRPPVTILRNQAYIGVLLDDLVTKVPSEPYRMFTSQSEYRLILRQDNADQRLSALGCEIGLLDTADHERARARWEAIADERGRLRERRLKGMDLQGWHNAEPAEKSGIRTRIRAHALTALDLGKTFEGLLRIPGIGMRELRELGYAAELSTADEAAIEAEIKYEGYIRKQEREIARTRAQEKMVIPEWVLADPPEALSHESRERLRERRPRTLGQATRIPGITPSDIFILAVKIRAGRGR